MLAALPKSLNELQLKITTVSHDDQLVLLWFSQKSETTIRTYQGTIRQFFASFPERSLRDLKLEDLFIWVSSLQKYAQNTQRHKIFIIKSLFSFAHKVGYLHANPALMLKQPREVETVTERIITQSNIKVIAENCLKLRDELIIKTLYSLGLRVSELTVLTWHDFMFTDEGIKVKVQGKGSKIRFIHVSEFLYKELEKLRQDSQYIFSSRKKKMLESFLECKFTVS